MNDEVRNIDIEIEQAKELIAMRDALIRLGKNKDFQKVISNGFLRDFALNTVAIRGRMEFRTNQALMDSNTRKLDAVGELEEYFRNVRAHGARMDVALKEAEEIRNEILATEE